MFFYSDSISYTDLVQTTITMAEKKEPTAAEAMLFFSIVKNTRNKADVDWNAVAEEAGFKNADVAKVSLHPCLPVMSPMAIHQITCHRILTQ